MIELGYINKDTPTLSKDGRVLCLIWQNKKKTRKIKKVLS